MNALIVNLNLSVDKTALVPAFEKGGIFRLDGTITLPGGKGVNVARALRSLGLESPVAGFASGYNGRWIADSLKKEGFLDFIQRHSAGESRVCYTIVDSRGVTTDLNEEGPVVPAAAQTAFLKKFSAPGLPVQDRRGLRAGLGRAEKRFLLLPGEAGFGAGLLHRFRHQRPRPVRGPFSRGRGDKDKPLRIRGAFRRRFQPHPRGGFLREEFRRGPEDPYRYRR